MFVVRSLKMEILLLFVAIFSLNLVLGLHNDHINRIQYTREFLLGLQWNRQVLDYHTDLFPTGIPTIDEEPYSRMYKPKNQGYNPGRTLGRKRGRRGGVRRRIRQQIRNNRTPLPSMVLANVQSLRNKIVELQGNAIHLREFRETCIMALTETWLTDMDVDPSLDINGFWSPIRLDRDCQVTGKSQGGGVCLYINRRWCSNITVREQLCLADIEVLSVSLRPFYLPREFPQIFVSVVYIHPRANAKSAADTIFKVIQRLQSISPDSPNIIMGDFNHCNLKDSLPSFYQYVSCPTRRSKTLDLCYGTIKGAYRSVAGPPLGSSDHNVVHLLPTYKTVLQREKVRKQHVKVWTEDSSLALQGCFECTDWSVFLNSTDDINELTDVVCSYIDFCKGSVIPTKEVKVFPNNKPWVSKELKGLICQRKAAFNRGDEIKVREISKELKAEIKKAKIKYKDKIEAEFRSNNSRAAWNGMKLMTGCHDKGRKGVSLDGFNSNIQLADSLNEFYLRFEKHDFKEQTDELKNKNKSSQAITIDVDTVVKLFRHTDCSKSSGPDEICGRVLRTCAEQLGSIFHFIFLKSLEQQKIPATWKHSTIVPVAKCKNPKILNDFRPVALTSLVMKAFEKIIKQAVLQQVQSSLDPLQFAYRAGRGVEDATLTLLNYLYHHLEGPLTHARLLFVDFSSAFNTIQPYLLAEKLLFDFNLDINVIGWILDFLTDRSQCVRVNGVLSNKLHSSTGSPQGCVLSPLLYILYTNSCQSKHQNRHIIKFADDSVILSLLEGEELGHGPVVDNFVSWCKESFLELNVSKTKDMIIDFRKSAPNPKLTDIEGIEIDLVENHKYLGTVFDNKLSFQPNVDAISKKVQQRLYFLRKMNSFNVCTTMMTLFYRSFIESVLSFCIVAWFGNLNLANKNRLGRLVKVSSKVIGVSQLQLSDLYYRQVLRKAQAILDCPDHPLQREFELLPSGRRYRVPAQRTKRYKVSFVCTAISSLNLHM